MIINRKDIADYSRILRDCGRRVVFTNGCFDLLHAGHVRYLAAARALGDCLIVGLNSDESVRALKGDGRPVNSERDRAAVLAALRAVDAVTVFGEATAATLIELIRPHVYAKGADYTLDTLPEAKLVQGYGGEVALLELLPGHSTTRLVARIRG